MTDFGNSQPFEHIYSEAEVWISPYGTTFPTDVATPDAGWTLIPTTEMAEGGVTVTFNEETGESYVEGSNFAVKRKRTRESAEISFSVKNMTAEMMGLFTGGNTATIGSTKAVLSLEKGTSMLPLGLVVRMPSPYGPDPLRAHWEFPSVVRSGSSAFQLSKGEPTTIEITFTANGDTTQPAARRVGEFIAQIPL